MTSLRHNGGFEIKTLGDFKVFFNGVDLIEKHNNSLRVWELFKYFITFKNQSILPEKIIYSICPDAEYSDPKRTLRALIFRLRKVLNVRKHSDSSSIIVHSGGCYKLLADDCSIDVIRFESLFNEAHDLEKNNACLAIDRYKEAIAMYLGDYLLETYEYDWLVPSRNHYRGIFLQSIGKLTGLLREQNRFNEVLAICEKALRCEMFEEDIHYKYIEALVNAKKIKQARKHYRYIADLYKREMDAELSQQFQPLYQLLFQRNSDLDLPISTNSLEEKCLLEGPILCDIKLFSFLYKLEKKRFERYGALSFVGLLTISLPGYALPPPQQLRDGMEGLKQALMETLRKGDVITKWNEAQYLLSLPCLSAEQAETALKKVENRFAALNSKLILHKRIQNNLPSAEEFPLAWLI